MANSKSYAFRLHPSNDEEAAAMDIIQQRLDAGFTMREIMCHAILKSEGHTPDMYRKPDDEGITRSYLYDLFSDLVLHMEDLLSRQQPSRQRIEYTPTETDLRQLLEKVKSEREGKPTNIDAISRAKNKLDKLD